MGIPSIHVYIQLAPQGISQQRLTQYTIPSVLNLESPFSYYLSSDYHVKYTLVADIKALEWLISECLFNPFILFIWPLSQPRNSHLSINKRYHKENNLGILPCELKHFLIR